MSNTDNPKKSPKRTNGSLKKSFSFLKKINRKIKNWYKNNSMISGNKRRESDISANQGLHKPFSKACGAFAKNPTTSPTDLLTP